MDAGINKPFDRIFKSLAEEAPVMLLRLLGVIPAGVQVEIEALRPETAPSVVLPDYVAVVRDAGQERIVHIEFQSSYYAECPRDMARYGGSLAWQYQMEVESVLVLLRPQGVPAEIPEVGLYRIGRTLTTHPFRVVRLWELDPAPVLDCHDPKLLPWAVLMKSSDAQVRGIASILGRQDDEEAIARFLTLGGIRYDRSSLEGMLGGGKMGLAQALLEASSIFQEVRDEGRVVGLAEGKAEGLAEGKAEGLAEGLAAGARQLLRKALRRDYPELESLPELDAISDIGVLESLFDQIADAHDVESARQAILEAAPKSH